MTSPARLYGIAFTSLMIRSAKPFVRFLSSCGVIRQASISNLQSSIFNRQWLVPANRLFVQIDVDLLRFQVLLDAPGAELPSEAGLFIAAPRCFDVCRLHVINPDDAGPQRLHRPQ